MCVHFDLLLLDMCHSPADLVCKSPSLQWAPASTQGEREGAYGINWKGGAGGVAFLEGCPRIHLKRGVEDGEESEESGLRLLEEDRD